MAERSIPGVISLPGRRQPSGANEGHGGGAAARRHGGGGGEAHPRLRGVPARRARAPVRADGIYHALM